jgi:hypothetical protein
MEGLVGDSVYVPDQENEKLQPSRAATAMSECQTPSRSLSTLPVEMQLHILPFLDYHSLRSFSQTSKYFQSLFANSISRDIIKASLLALESDPGQRDSILVNRNHLPCYRCFRILHAKDRFSNLDTYRSTRRELGDGRAQSRRCMSCRYSYLTNSGQSELFVRGGQCWVACARCKQVKLYAASNASMKIAWQISRSCVECAKAETNGDAQKREKWRESLARYYRWKQAAVAVQQPVKVECFAETLAESPIKPGKKTSGSQKWLSLRRIFTSAR